MVLLDPSVSLTLASSPNRGAEGGVMMQNVKNGATSLPNHRHSEEGEARRGNPFPLRRTKITHSPKGMRIATASVRTGFAMTG